jgi:hypothetical protein
MKLRLRTKRQISSPTVVVVVVVKFGVYFLSQNHTPNKTNDKTKEDFSWKHQITEPTGYTFLYLKMITI